MRFEELTRGELRELAPDATVVVPVGAIEQHGPHLPVCADTAIVTHLAHAAADIVGDSFPLVVTPTMPFGFSHHHVPLGGTISISSSVLVNVLTDISQSLAAGGFRRIVFVNGHGGNAAAVSVATQSIAYENDQKVHVAGTSYWHVAADVLAELDLDGAPRPGHAGSFETSCLLALRPDLVRMDKLPQREAQLQPMAELSDYANDATVRKVGIWEDSDGRTDDSHAATAEIGQQVLAAIATKLADFLTWFHKTCK
jgi:creatinine amidohydrolase